MKFIHTADLHFGQVLYQSYTRSDEHDCFFSQLKAWCTEYRPDALLFCGDIFDIQQPGANVKEAFTHKFVDLHDCCPEMKIIITAGNHDSASRLQAESEVWRKIGVYIVGVPPASDAVHQENGWQDRFIITLENGYIAALPYMQGKRREVYQAVLDRINELNTESKPVVMMAHLAVSGADITGHGFEIGSVMTQELSELGSGYDYLALGHIHKPQTLGRESEWMEEKVVYPSGTARYSGSPLHVSCDEAFPHSISLVEIPFHNSEVSIRQLKIQQLRHFYTLPENGESLKCAEDGLSEVKKFSAGQGGYFRLVFEYGTPLPSNFTRQVYDIIAGKENIIRYNPKIIWTGAPQEQDTSEEKPRFEVADLQQMTDPLEFISETMDDYPELDPGMLADAFELVRREIAVMNEESASKLRVLPNRKSEI